MTLGRSRTDRNLNWGDRGVGITVGVGLLVVALLAWALWNQHQESRAQGAQLTVLTALVKTDSTNTGKLNTLLRNGKTASAISGKATEKLAEKIQAEAVQIKAVSLETQQVIKAGKSAGAEESKLAAQAAVKGLAAEHEALAELHSQTNALAADIAANHGSGLQTRSLICKLLTHDGIPVSPPLCPSG